MSQHNAQCMNALRTRKIAMSDKNDCGTAYHTLNTGHNCNFNNVEILAIEKSEYDRKLRESIEIYTHEQKGYKLANNMAGTPFAGCWYEILNYEKIKK